MRHLRGINDDSFRPGWRNRALTRKTWMDLEGETPRSSHSHSSDGVCIVAVGPRWHSPQPPSQPEGDRAHDQLDG